jgi:hypothetical protein
MNGGPVGPPAEATNQRSEHTMGLNDIFEQIINFFEELFSSIVSFFEDLFGGNDD